MRRFCLSLILLIAACAMSAQVGTPSYVLTRTMLNDIGNSYLDNITYYDGLGRPFQTVQKAVQAGNAVNKNLATLQEYDAVGRETNGWLPIPVTSSVYLAPASFKSGAPGKYGNDSRPYSQSVYEASPLNRVLQQYGPGAAWYSAGRAVKTEYLTNTGVAPLNCRYYSVTGSYVLSGGTASYASGQLSVVKTTDEDLNVSYTFTDKMGHVVLSRQMKGSETHDTYYVYDDKGNLCFVLQPMYQSSANLDQYAFQYKYDGRNRCIWKKLPGAEYVEMMYDNADRLVFSQDGNQRALTSGNWTYYKYDSLNRLTDAVHGAGHYTEKVTAYDKNGNIKNLQRYGQTSASAYGLVDNLTFTLNGNRLSRVDDAATASAYGNGFEFKDGAKQADEYAYDANGNLTKDLNKNITNIRYNFLNLPIYFSFNTGGFLQHGYTADGVRRRTIYKELDGPTSPVTTVYCGNVIYENNVPRLLLHEEGYVTLDDNSYHYYVKDHQGNNCLVVDSSGAVEEANHYYPFGGVFASTGNVQPYKYNGKELDTEKGLNWYDYGARQYDAALGRFTTVDPLAEKYYGVSPYAYCGNNPVRYIDPTGMFISPIYDKEGKLLGTDAEGLQGTAIIMDKSNFKQGMSHEEALSHDLGYDGLVNDEARSNYATSYARLKDRPDYDGYLTLKEANQWYREGKGQPLYVDISKIDLSPLSIEDLSLSHSVPYNFLSPKHPNMRTGLVYGNLSIMLLNPNGAIRIGNQNGRIDIYDFDYHKGGSTFRNFATRIGSKVAGKGISYEIYGYGLGNVGHRVNRPFSSRKWFL